MTAVWLTVRNRLLTRIRPPNHHSVTTFSTLHELFFPSFLSFSSNYLGIFGAFTSARSNCSLQFATIGQYAYPRLKGMTALSNAKVGKVVVHSGLMLENKGWMLCICVGQVCTQEVGTAASLTKHLVSVASGWKWCHQAPSSCTLHAILFFSAHVGKFWLKGFLFFYFICFFSPEKPKCVISPFSN